MRDPTFKIGMKFANSHEFKEACKAYGIKHRYKIHFPTNDKKRVQACCFKKCGWKIWASRLNPRDPSDVTMQIKTSHFEHSCGVDFSNFHVTVKWLASHYLETFRHNPIWSLNGIIARVKANFSFIINPVKAWRAREFSLKTINGDKAKQYSRLHDYKLELLRTNLGRIATFKEEKGKFEGIYICLTALKEAFKDGCRPLICVDGCWLKGNYSGQLLTAVGIDPNDCIFPIAFVVVLTENKDNW
ncbi:uncharacterized protein LOC131176783 [Hevea brasiliensis]|uniref:uncharacterized protein LOC131176783 n=1 Tax=Hevea brasiliensis TaxID=3981 RepID=UPI0025F0670D|nr:uncharacterized protein LOC131176783 [Hevea brasiliensis]